MINVTIKIDSDMNTMQLDKIKQFLIEVQEILRPAPDTESAFSNEDAKDNMLAFAFLDRAKHGGTVRTEDIETLVQLIRRTGIHPG